MYRIRSGDIEVLLAHPSGPFFQKKDEGAWSIPKGEIEPDEDTLEAAQREFEEETGIKPAGPFIQLTRVKQKGGKIVHAWAFDKLSLRKGPPNQRVETLSRRNGSWL